MVTNWIDILLVTSRLQALRRYRSRVLFMKSHSYFPSQRSQTKWFRMPWSAMGWCVSYGHSLACSVEGGPKAGYQIQVQGGMDYQGLSAPKGPLAGNMQSLPCEIWCQGAGREQWHEERDAMCHHCLGPGRTLLTVEEEIPSPAASFSSGWNYLPRVVTWKWGESGVCPTLSCAGCCLPHCAGTKLQGGLRSHF